MWPFKGKKQRIITRRYKAVTASGAQRKMEKDANKLAAQGYRLVSSQDKGRSLAVNHGDVFATYELSD